MQKDGVSLPFTLRDFFARLGLSGMEGNSLIAVPDRVLSITADDDAYIRKAAEKTFSHLMTTVEHIIRTHDYRGFDLSPELIRAIEQSWHVGEPHIVGRFDGAYVGPDDIRFYEYNVVTASSVADAGLFLPLLMERLTPNEAPQSTMTDDLKRVFVELAQRSELNDKPFFYQSECPEADSDVERDYVLSVARAATGGALRFAQDFVAAETAKPLLDARAGLDELIITRFLPRLRGQFPHRQSQCEQLSAYYLEDRWRVLPPAWTILLDRKAIWAHAFALDPFHPHLIPTSFDERDFHKGGRYYGRMNSTLYLAKPNDGYCANGIAVYDAEKRSGKNGPLPTHKGQSNIFQAYCPPPCFAHPNNPVLDADHVVARPFIVGQDGRASALCFSEMHAPIGAGGVLPHRVLQIQKPALRPANTAEAS